jgi:hypothetical protein
MQALGLVWENLDPLNANLRETVTEIPEPVHYGARLLFGHWRDLQKQGGLIVGRDVPSRRLGGILRNLAVFEPLDGAADFHARLAGTAFLRRFGRDITGLKLSEIFRTPVFELHRDNLAKVVRNGVPGLYDVKVYAGRKRSLHCDLLRLPAFSPDRGTVWVLSGLFFHD